MSLLLKISVCLQIDFNGTSLKTYCVCFMIHSQFSVV